MKRAMRLAWFMPMPPADRTAATPAIAAVSAVAGQHDLEIFAGSAAEAAAWAGWQVPVRDAVEFLWRHARRPYGLQVYQLGNTPRHDFVWGYLWNYPGLLVLEDRHFHAARARILLDRLEPRLDEYAAELSFNHGVAPDIRRALALFTGGTLSAWPMRRAALAAARAVAVHGQCLSDELRPESPASIELLPLASADPGGHAALRSSPRSRALRQRLRIDENELLVGVIGPLRRSRRVPEILQAIVAVRAAGTRLRLLLAGSPSDDCDLDAHMARAGVGAAVSCESAVSDEDLDAALGASDAVLCLGWPPSGELNALWLRCLAAGVPTVVTDQTDYGDFPLLDPRDAERPGPGEGTSVRPPLALLSDLAAEQQTLRLALRRLAAEPGLRARLGEAARARWSSRNTAEHLGLAYLRCIDHAAQLRPPTVVLPDHHRPDVFAHARRLVRSVGAALPSELSPPRPPTAESP
jgi:glycosyltransferase involved in cell wall biosynthesis